MTRTFRDTDELGRFLRLYRLKAGLTCRQVARSLGWDHSELSRIERGQPTSLARYRAIAKALRLALTLRIDHA